jgi:hypothetical protein
LVAAAVFIFVSLLFLTVLALSLAWALNWAEMANKTAAFFKTHSPGPALWYGSPTYYRIFGSVLGLASTIGLGFWIAHLLAAR